MEDLSIYFRTLCKMRRTQLDWTMGELSQRMDRCPEYVSRLLNGRVPMTDKMRQRLTDVLGLRSYVAQFGI